jgi:hypothetical protein
MAGVHPTESRWFPLPHVMPSLLGMSTAVDEAKQNRDATLAVIALYRYRNRHGEWPETLDQLVPEFLPSVPIDQVDGEPLGYRLVDGQPLLYSVGGNGTDGGGTRSKPSYPGLTTSDGDWILWPPAEPETP